MVYKKNHSSVFVLQSLRRKMRQTIAGISKVKGGEPFRVGSKIAMLPINIFFSKFHCPNKSLEYRNTTLTWEEEEKVVQKLQDGNHIGGYVPHNSIKRATQEVVWSLPSRRRKSIPYNNRPPSNTFCELFERRHCYAIYCFKYEMQDGTEAPMVTARDVVTYFHDLKDMIVKDNIKCGNIWCLTARTVEVDIGEESTFVKYLTVFAVANASGLLLSYTHLVHNEQLEDAISESEHFEYWLSHVIERIEMEHSPNSNSTYHYHLLLCDESCFFVNEEVREWLFKRHVIVFSIPGFSDGFAGNHDVGCANNFVAKFKEYMTLDISMQSPPKRSWTENSLHIFIQMARFSAMTERTIKDSFMEAGIYPLDEIRFFKHPRPLSISNPGKICDIQSMCDMLDAKSNGNAK